MARILVIEDDPSLALAIKTVIRNEGLDVMIAASGRCGLEAAETADIDVIIVDIFTPGMDGIETIRALRECAPDVPIIAVSGHFRASAGDILAGAAGLRAALSGFALAR